MLADRSLGMLVPGWAFGGAAQPHAADQAGQYEQAAQAAGSDRGDRAARQGPRQGEPATKVAAP